MSGIAADSPSWRCGPLTPARSCQSTTRWVRQLPTSGTVPAAHPWGREIRVLVTAPLPASTGRLGRRPGAGCAGSWRSARGARWRRSGDGEPAPEHGRRTLRIGAGNSTVTSTLISRPPPAIATGRSIAAQAPFRHRLHLPFRQQPDRTRYPHGQAAAEDLRVLANGGRSGALLARPRVPLDCSQAKSAGFRRSRGPLRGLLLDADNPGRLNRYKASL